MSLDRAVGYMVVRLLVAASLVAAVGYVVVRRLEALEGEQRSD